jgi:flavin reductase (DIM6/NTAB) family NADH-FMN oxidoreductase RutF
VKQEIPLSLFPRLFNCGPLVFVSARYRDRANLMPAGWLTPLSLDPPLLGAAIHPKRFTHDLIRKSGQFAVNIATRRLAEAAQKCGSVSGHDGIDKWALGLFTMAEPKVIEAPLVEECLAWIECGVVNAFDTGDHTLFVGEVLVARVEEEAFSETWLLPDEELKPLHYLGGEHFALLEKVIKVPKPPAEKKT